MPSLVWLRSRWGKLGSTLANRRETSRRVSAWLAEAADPGTPVESLLRVCDESQRFPVGAKALHRVWDALAAHPNLPAPTLMKLVGQGHAAAFCRNPAAPLLALSDPDAVLGAHPYNQRQLLAYGGAPPPLVALLAQSDNAGIAEEARLHTALTSDAEKDGWRAEVAVVVQREFDAAVRSDPWQRRLLWELRDYGLLPPWLRTDAFPAEIDLKLPAPNRQKGDGGSGPSPDGSLCVALPSLKGAAKTHSAYQVLTRASHHSETTAEALVFIAENAGTNDLQRAADLLRHPNADAHVLRTLIRRVRRPEVRRAVLAHPAAPRNMARHCRTAALLDGRRSGGDTAAYFLADLNALSGDTWTDLSEIMDSPWPARLSAALGDEAVCRPWLLRRLSEDGNRLVRAAARARLRREYRMEDLFTPTFGA